MTRPTISPGVVAQLTEAAPGRLIRKLDKQPDRAESWEWSTDGDTTTVTTDADATVTLSAAVITSKEQVGCDCLLAPKCLHLLSVVTRLELCDAEPSVDSVEVEAEAEPTLHDVEVSDDQRAAARAIVVAIEGILGDGVNSASIVAQGRLLTALHHGRVVGLHRASAGSTRAIKRIRGLREGKTEKLDLLREDLIDILDACDTVIANDVVSVGSVGVARRQYHDAGSLKLHGIVTAPILSDGGYGGCVTYLLDEKGGFSTVSTVQPRDLGGAKKAWLQSVQIGDITAPHEALCRKQVFIQDATRSDDGRLGAGKKVKAVVGKPVDFDAGPIARWFETPLEQQIESVYAKADVPFLLRPPGWDFIALEATVLGQHEEGVVLSLGEEEAPVLALYDLDVRDNLARLGTMVGSSFRFVARVELDRFRSVRLMTILYQDDDDHTISVQLGLEHFQIERERQNVTLDFPDIPNVWGAFDRALERALLGGWRAFPPQSKPDVRREQLRMKRNGLYHGATRLGSLYDACQRPSAGSPNAHDFSRAWRDGVRYRELFLRAVAHAQW